MTRPSDRDAALDRILRRLDVVDAPSSSSACLDAETVAAMADGGLLPPAQAAAVAHASSCARCQALLAAVIRTMPEPEPRGGWWRMPSWGWLAPVAAAGLAVAIWVAVDLRRPSVTMVAVSAPPSQTVPQPSDSARAKSREDKDATPPATAPPPRQAGRTAPPSAVDQRAGASRPPEAAPSPAPAPMLAPPAEAPAQAAAAISPGAPPPPVADGAVDGVRAGKQNRAEAFGSADRASAGARAVSVITLDIPSSDPRMRWKVVGASVQRSTDGGATWTGQATGTTARIAAGSAPQPDVCWLVGQDGVVLLSTDGLSWQRLTFPIQTALVSVRATSADAATVTTNDGRTFATTDRGVSWVPR